MSILMRILHWILSVMATIIFTGTLFGESMWGWIAIFWLIMSLKHSLEAIFITEKTRWRKNVPYDHAYEAQSPGRNRTPRE